MANTEITGCDWRTTQVSGCPRFKGKFYLEGRIKSAELKDRKGRGKYLRAKGLSTFYLTQQGLNAPLPLTALSKVKRSHPKII
ncbi:hypothetical protein [Nostoc sp.]|uniref:hypothetical protein n=1 Tax=Nostoc sp. TaxID=1180 RepID=UPI002FFC89DD